MKTKEQIKMMMWGAIYVYIILFIGTAIHPLLGVAVFLADAVHTYLSYRKEKRSFTLSAFYIQFLIFLATVLGWFLGFLIALFFSLIFGAAIISEKGMEQVYQKYVESEKAKENSLNQSPNS